MLTAASPRVYYTGPYPTTPMTDADAAFTVNTTAKFWAAGEVSGTIKVEGEWSTKPVEAPCTQPLPPLPPQTPPKITSKEKGGAGGCAHFFQLDWLCTPFPAPCAIPHAPYNVLSLVIMLVVCWLVLAIRCCVRSVYRQPRSWRIDLPGPDAARVGSGQDHAVVA